MCRFALVQAIPAVVAFAVVATASPYARLHQRQNGTAWPSEIAHEAHDYSWPQFVNETIRWSTYEPPSFDEVFLPETEEDLSTGVSCDTFLC